MHIDDEQLVADFVRRLRRVALHPLALDEDGGDDVPPMPGNLLRRFLEVPTVKQENEDGTVTLTSPLPDEVLFESLSTRLRPFTLARDRLYWEKAIDALDRLINSNDPTLSGSSRDVREEWTQATDRTSRARAFHMGVQSKDGGETHHLTDVDLAYGWLYQDVAHGDASSTGLFGVKHRFQAAVSVFSSIAVVALETLHYINHLVEDGLISLPVGTMFEEVIVTDAEFSMIGAYIETPVGDDLSDPAWGASVPEELRPAFELARQSIQLRAGDPESEVVTMEVRPGPITES